MAELILSAMLPVLFEKLASREFWNFLRQEGLDSKIEKLESTWRMIEEVLKDAEGKELTSGSVKLWLDNLKHVAYDMEDLLDELATEALKQKVMEKHQASTSKVLNLIPACFNSWTPSVVKFNVTMGSNIDDITSRFEQLCDQRNRLGLQILAEGSSTASLQRPPPTTRFSNEPAVGRDNDKDKILEMMSTAKSGDANFLAVAIVGTGGLGKTTLARSVYDEAIKKFKFDIKAWVCVSDDIDVVRLFKKILDSFLDSSFNSMEFNKVQEELNKQIANKRFLLVLDDVWSNDDDMWRSLKASFNQGAPGSKIIVTTRQKNVASTIASDHIYLLEFLSDDACWLVFEMYAFGNGDGNGAQQNLENEFRKKVVEKCGGLPLAARTLGGLLQSKKSYKEWDDLLNSKIWDLQTENNKIPQVLKLSYHYLPSHLKRCFAYCSILPNDYEFEKKELVLLWMAEGFIQKSQGDKQLEDIGSEFFGDLVSRSIFQQSSTDMSKYVMHDLIHDLAQWASGESSFRLEEGTETNQQLRRDERVRHSSYTSHDYDGKNRFDVFRGCECLRTFLPINIDLYSSHYITNMVLFYLLSKFKKLRVLSLSGYCIMELPDSIGVLKHLRYLNLSYTWIRSLPESTSSLFNLQSLLLRDCQNLKKLPLNMKLLINLRHLDIKGVSSIKELPLGLNGLTCLQTLSNFIVGNNTGSSLNDLKHLKFLSGELCISRLESVSDSEGIREVILSDKKDLKILSLEWSNDDDNSQNETKEENVLDMLRPHGNIEELTIKGYSGKRFPSWIRDSSFCNMVVLKLENCKRCTSLPLLDQLSSLEIVTFKGMNEIRRIDYEIFGESCSKPFVSLRALCFEDLQELEQWEPINKSDDLKIFPQLRKLSIVKCPKLTGRLPDNLPSLEELVVRECGKLDISNSSLLMHKRVTIDACKEMVCNDPSETESLNSMTVAKRSEFGNWLKQGYQKLHLRIFDRVYFWKSEISSEKLPQEFSYLKKLCIQNCPALVSLPEINFFPTLSELAIKNCNSLTSLAEAMKHDNTCLEELEIKNCDSLTFIVKGQLPQSLKRLFIRNCKKLELLFDDREDTCASFLEELEIESCPSLTCLSSRGQLSATLKILRIWLCPNLLTLSSIGQLPVALTKLDIWTCSKLEAIAERFHNNMSLKSISIRNCENLTSLPQGLQDLNSLDDFYLLLCPNLVCFPEGGLPNTISNFIISTCEKLEELPHCIHSLNSLQYLSIEDCPSIKSFPAEGFPTNLTSLEVENNLEIYKALKEWGLYKFTSLTRLVIRGCPDVVSFPEDEMEKSLPLSLRSLRILDFLKFKCLSSNGFRNLTSLKELEIWNCPNLSSFPKGALPPSLEKLDIYLCPKLSSFPKEGLPSSLEELEIDNCPKLSSFPKEGLPSSLLQLCIKDCPLLKKQCKKDKGREWSKIVDIPCVVIDDKFIFDPDFKSHKERKYMRCFKVFENSSSNSV